MREMKIDPEKVQELWGQFDDLCARYAALKRDVREGRGGLQEASEVRMDIHVVRAELAAYGENAVDPEGEYS